MRNKVVYISIIILIAVAENGYSQKSSLSLLPSRHREMYYYGANSGETNLIMNNASRHYSDEILNITPGHKRVNKTSELKKYRLCNIFGSICKKEWSSGIFRLFRLPSASVIIP